ncbi:hypothetical protein [Cognatishimia sp. F0-27]|uniref:hypothetical protein n=1 Tax=Cognatishimia sp. F0-27 TaxID=2816855 RepID=UPI001D0C873A|nr:hypothetical protein [Cognatishimia sp. F0-27]MCC1491655.1 hypothetical protein [Cognatishimia sp. F0-27]
MPASPERLSVPMPSEKRVIARLTVEAVIAAATVARILTGRTGQRIIARAAGPVVEAEARIPTVVARGAFQHIGTAESKDPTLSSLRDAFFDAGWAENRVAGDDGHHRICTRNGANVVSGGRGLSRHRTDQLGQ